MVSPSAPKRKRISQVKSSHTSAGVFEVEEVIGFKLVKSELRFFVKCKSKNFNFGCNILNILLNFIHRERL